MSFIAGKYDITYKGTAVGQARDPSIEYFVNKQLIVGDNFATSPQDAIVQGMEAFVEFTMMEFNLAGALGAFWPYDSAFGTPGVIGRTEIAGSITGALVLTPLTGTPAAAATAGPGAGSTTTFTAAEAVIAEGFPVRILHAPSLKEVPMRMRLYPDSGNSNRLFVWS